MNRLWNMYYIKCCLRQNDFQTMIKNIPYIYILRMSISMLVCVPVCACVCSFFAFVCVHVCLFVWMHWHTCVCIGGKYTVQEDTTHHWPLEPEVPAGPRWPRRPLTGNEDQSSLTAGRTERIRPLHCAVELPIRADVSPAVPLYPYICVPFNSLVWRHLGQPIVFYCRLIYNPRNQWTSAIHWH